MNKPKGKISTVAIVLVTLVLAGVAIFTAIRLYQLRQTSVAPNAPASTPHAQEVSNCNLSFTIGAAETATPSGTPTGTPTPTPTGSGTPGPTATPNSCGGTCGSNFNCASNLVCYNGFCRNPSCTSQTDCNCPGATTTPGPTTPSLPQSGIDWPTTAGLGVGIFAIIGALILAL